MSNELNKIKAKIRALTSKTIENGCTEAEAVAAMQKVGELLEIYNLNLTDVQLSEEICIEDKVFLRRRTIPRWAHVFASIGAFTQTKPWTNRPYIYFFGFEPDVQMAVYLSNIVLNAMETETAAFKHTKAYLSTTRRRFATNSFKLGLARRLDERLVRPAGKGIVLHKMAAVETELRNQQPDLRFRSRPNQRVRINRDAYNAGQEAGDRVNLNRPVGGSVGVLTTSPPS
ncbi:MAG: DUF2786 domain-containing protein [Nitratireductor sp.]|uniref:DUF2786 domain-containing protein n=1 Tax=Nitratireductor sp. TaxID=1872084 RepID=UPI0026174B31|nr:DUF2786 domain-containing protein [Nitratireductor sp.]MCV0350226.1 DUF2786 domain-containing protein [Nitratireductor sp.]